jgi:hydroxymethylpyrimidine pyrophosphatase-like HAD family hydrolase
LGVESNQAKGLQSLADAPAAAVAGVGVIATDVDGTLTTDGTFAPGTIGALVRLQAAGIATVAVTGRSAGWGAALAAYLPALAGVVAENGAVLCLPGADTEPVRLDEGGVGDIERADAALAEAIAELGPAGRPGADNFCRLTDRTLAAGPGVDPDIVAGVAARWSLRHTWSSVHHHLSVSSLDKRSGLLAALPRLVPAVAARTEVATIGDSGNDAPLWTPDSFALTVGVATVVDYLDGLGERRPAYVTEAAGGDGFAELVAAVLAAKG